MFIYSFNNRIKIIRERGKTPNTKNYLVGYKMFNYEIIKKMKKDYSITSKLFASKKKTG